MSMGSNDPQQGRLTRRELLRGSVATGAVMLLAGCAPSAPPASTAAPAAKGLGTVNVIIGAEISGFDPAKTLQLEDFSAINAMVDKLARMSATNSGQLEPRLATSWQAVEPTRWRFKLREGVKFHNGSAFDAETAKWSIERYAKEALPALRRRMPVERVDVVDKHTIDVITAVPTGLVPLYMNGGADQLDPKWTAGPEYSTEKAMGTGPTRFVEWVKGQRLVLEANPDFWGGKQPYDRIVIRAVSDNSTRANAAIAGEGDIVRNILPQDVARVSQRQGVSVKTVASNRVVSIRFRDDEKPFDNKLVRQALNYAVNVGEIIKSVLGGYGVPVQGWTQGPSVQGFQKDITGYPFDPEKAKSLLAQAGFPKGFTTKIGTSRGLNQGDFEFVQALAGQLRQVGIEAEVVLHESGAYSAIINGEKPSEPLVYWSSGNIIPDVENGFRDLITERSFMVRAPELKGFFDKLQSTVDQKERERIGREGILFLRDYAPVIFGYQMVQTYAVSDRLAWAPRADEWILPDEIGARSA
ncbi:MAG: hypothetical protein HY718_12760 [Planctomycetes bacterium]|nr:hypothetical protein [Planctomycetota bacterium]